jgi:hypothetical protein
MERVAMNTSTKSLQLLSLLIADFCNKICQEPTSGQFLAGAFRKEVREFM